jgi:ferric-dicitrate binding protein FerR (iron transport regulator)
MRKSLHPISALIIKKLEGTITPLERQTLDQWINESKENKDLFEELCDEYRMSQDLNEHSEDKRATWAKIISMAPELDETPVRRIRWMRYAGVAAVLLMTGLGVWYFAFNNTQKESIAKVVNKSKYKNDVAAPTGNNAVLRLANGNTINLDDANNGQLAEQGTMEIVKQDNGTIEYRESSDVNRESVVQYNTISTNRGGKYKIVLADNSVVWLNSVSSLKYPTTFTGDERVVELTGEAYFEVAKSMIPGSTGAAPKRKPFIVKLNGMQVDVLGTHFNIMSYSDESAIRTTLLEGSVRVTPVPVSGGAPVGRNSRLLSPGQQAILAGKAIAADNNDPFKVVAADTEEAVAWKDAAFVYNKASIETIMREIARSYDVEVEYEGGRTDEKFTIMWMSRNVPVSKVLQYLELTEKVKFEIEGRKITVKKV